MNYPSYTDRAKNAKNPVAQRLLTLMEEKKTNLCVSADFTKAADILKLAEDVGDEICVLKTHVDIIDDFTPDFPKQLREIADQKNFLIFEDRKFADIGNTVRMQFAGGIYKIAEWADIVNVHAVTNVGPLVAIYNEASKNPQKQIGVLILAQMTPKQIENAYFFDKDYAEKSFILAAGENKHATEKDRPNAAMGFIGSSEQPEILQKLRNGEFDIKLSPEDKKELTEAMLIMTPGIKMEKGDDQFGQTYNTPEKAISNGSDVIIVGRGIYQANDPAAAAEEYRAAGWEAYLARCK